MIHVCTKFHISTFNGRNTQMQHTALISEIMALEIRVYVVLKDYVQGTFSVLQN